jgi:hypothetical protein
MVQISPNKYVTLIEYYNDSFLMNQNVVSLIQDEVKDNKRKKMIEYINYASLLMRDDNYISNSTLKIYSPVLKIFLGSDRPNISSASPDIRGTPRTNRIKNIYSEEFISQVDISTKDLKNSNDFFRGKALLKTSTLPKETPKKQNSEEIKGSQSSSKSTPEFKRYQ